MTIHEQPRSAKTSNPLILSADAEWDNKYGVPVRRAILKSDLSALRKWMRLNLFYAKVIQDKKGDVQGVPMLWFAAKAGGHRVISELIAGLPSDGLVIAGQHLTVEALKQEALRICLRHSKSWACANEIAKYTPLRTREQGSQEVKAALTLDVGHHCSLKVLDFLLQRGCDFNAQDALGNTPLMSIIKGELPLSDFGQYTRDAFDVLVMQADWGLLNHEGESLLMLAIKAHRHSLVRKGVVLTPSDLFNQIHSNGESLLTALWSYYCGSVKEFEEAWGRTKNPWAAKDFDLQQREGQEEWLGFMQTKFEERELLRIVSQLGISNADRSVTKPRL